jgi:hypothetical protein
MEQNGRFLGSYFGERVCPLRLARWPRVRPHTPRGAFCVWFRSLPRRARPPHPTNIRPARAAQPRLRLSLVSDFALFAEMVYRFLEGGGRHAKHAGVRQSEVEDKKQRESNAGGAGRHRGDDECVRFRKNPKGE